MARCTSEGVMDGRLAALLAERRLGGLGSLGREKSLIQRTVGRFKSYKEDKLKQEKPPGKISQDRLKPDKKLLLELTKLETVIVIKRRLESSVFISRYKNNISQ